MLQRHITTTSFIVASDESLNKPSSILSGSSSACGQSTDSGENMSTTTATSTSDSHTTEHSYTSQSSTDFIQTNNLVDCKHRQLSQQVNGRYSMLPPQPVVPPPPPPKLQATQDGIYETSRDQTSLQSLYGIHRANGPTSHESSLNYMTTDQQRPMQPSLTLSSQQNLVKSFQNSNHKKYSPNSNIIAQRPATSHNLDQPSSTLLMPMNVKGMLLHGLSSEEVMRNWLISLKCDDLIKNFVDHGYDIHLITRMTPQDLAAIGCKSPILRKKLLSEIRKLNLDYDLPEYKPMILEQWLESLKLKSYYTVLVTEGYDTVEKTCKLTWEDLEEIGIVKLGHQKRLLLGIEKVQKSLKLQEERQNDSAIYDVHPNHRVSLNVSANLDGRMTIGRVRSGLFQTKPGANLDHRGLPVATVMPALKHISSPIVNSDKTKAYVCETMQIRSSQINQSETLKMSEFKRNPPPLPPVRTNSLKFVEPNGEQQIYDNNHYGAVRLSTNGNSTLSPVMGTNSTSFLRAPSHKDTIEPNVTLSNPIVPIRVAPPPPHMQHRISVPGRIDEELSSLSCSEQQNGPTLMNGSSCNNNISNQFITTRPIITSDDEFPPPPPPP